jgi:hypothetical protein
MPYVEVWLDDDVLADLCEPCDCDETPSSVAVTALELLHDEHHKGPFCLCFHEACRSGREGFWVHTGKPR